MNWKVIFLTVLLVGCAAKIDLSLTSDPQTWRDYGQHQASNGVQLESESKIAKHSSSGTVSSEQYQAYLDGFQVGKKAYCEQDPRWLARTGKPYTGICDDINPFFRADYENTLYENW